jgi:hypothetical protein
MKMNELTKAELKLKLKALEPIDKETKKNIVCSLIGHSDIVDFCMGYVSCGRCGAHLGDTLAGIYPRNAKQVIIDHDCDTCRENWENMTWKDKFMVKYSLQPQ